MKKIFNYIINSIFLSTLCMMQTSTLMASTTKAAPASKTHQASSPVTHPTSQTKKIASAPHKAHEASATNSSLFTPSMSLDSINEKSIDEIYGKKGLNLADADITQIKQTYSYIENITKIQKINSDPKLAKDKAFFAKFSSSKNSSSASQEMMNSKEWKSITLTNADIEASDVWQLYLKSMIVDYYENQADFLETISMIQDQIFPYLPNIEINFYNNEFITLRSFAELLRAKKILQDSSLQQYLSQCISWKGKDQATLDANVAAFKKTDFYTYTHDSKKWTAATKNMPHPLEEYVMSYFMITTIQSTVQNKLTQKNLLSFLSQASSTTISPNFFYYQPTDFVCLDDILNLQQKLNGKMGSATTGLQQSFDLKDLVDLSKANVPQEPQNVVTQKIKNPFKKITKSIKKGVDDVGKDIKKAADDTGKGITDAADATGKGIVTAADDIGKGITDTATSAETGLVSSAESTATSTVTGLESTAKATGKDLDVKGIAAVATSAAATVEHGAQGVGQGIAGSGAIAVGTITGDKSTTNWGKNENKTAKQQMKQSGKAFNATISNLSKLSLVGCITHGVEGVALGAAGFGATMVGDIVYAQTGNKSIKNWGAKQSAKAVSDIQAAGKEIDAAITGLASALEDGIIAPIAIVAGNAAGFVLHDQKIGQDMTMMLDQISDSVINLGATCFESINNIDTQALVSTYKISESGAEIIVDGLMTLYGGVTGQTAVVNRSAAMTTATTKGFIKNIAQAATATLSCVMTTGMDLVMGVAAIMAAVENSMTTIVFDMVREITYLGCSLGELLGAPVNAAQERDKISAKMEAHRSTINIVMGVVLMVVITVATLGTAAPAVPALLAAEAAGETTAVVGTEVATEVAANAAIETAAEAANTTATAVVATETVSSAGGQAATQGVTEAATEASGQATTEGATTAANSTATEATQEGGEQATQEASTQVAEEGTQDAAENSATRTERLLGEKNAALLAAYGGDMLGQVINLVFSVFSIISADNQDEAAIRMLAQEKASIMNLWQFIESNKVVMTQSQNLYIDELHKKHQVAIENQNLGLNYYTNYLNSSINNIESQISHALSQQYTQLLTPDANGSRMADIGSTWGLKTPFVYLYPSQGFLTTTLGRSDFPYAQEIAQAPLAAQDQAPTSTKDTLDNSKKASSKLWFNQRAVANVNQSADEPLNVEIKFRVIYNLTTDFYVGLYLGGKYYNYSSPEYLADIQNTGGIHLDDAHLAKMFVLKREGNEKIPSLGVYENEGKGWLVKKSLSESLFNSGTTYYMSATLQKDKLTVAFWPSNNPSAKWSTTTTVTPSDQRTFGVIFSGAAIEWNVIKPSMPIEQNTKVRAPLGNQPEADRERGAKKIWASLKNPTFGSMKLTSIGKKYLLQGQYLYSTQDTALKNTEGKVIADLIAFATFASGEISNIGVSPADASVKPNAIISMINGDIYNDQGVNVGNKQNPWNLFVKNNGPLNKALLDSVMKAQKSCPQKPAATTAGTVSLSNIAIGATPSTGGFQLGLSNKVPATTKAPAQSFDQRQTKAAAGATVQVGGLAGTDTAIATMSTDISNANLNGASIGSAGFSL